jgi:cytochrome subunit of sulfide dehydrogenase
MVPHKVVKMTHMSAVLPTLVRAPRAGLVRAVWIASGLGLALSAHAQSRDPTAFQTEVWAVSCMACHGPDGRAEGAGRAIGGLPANDLLGKLLDYKHGQLKGTIMHQHTKGYSDEELTRIAEYFSKLK